MYIQQPDHDERQRVDQRAHQCREPGDELHGRRDSNDHAPQQREAHHDLSTQNFLTKCDDETDHDPTVEQQKSDQSRVGASVSSASFHLPERQDFVYVSLIAANQFPKFFLSCLHRKSK